MSDDIRLEYRKRPTAAHYMAGALLPSPGLPPDGALPRISARWSQHRVHPGELESFLELCGLDGSRESGCDSLPLLYPHVIGFPMQMAVLTHPRFPVPIWRMLQVRNRLLQLAPLSRRMPFDLTVGLAGSRILDKGAEFDLRVTANADGQTLWEGVTTFYTRGRFGAPRGGEPSSSPAPDETIVAEWRLPVGSGRRFGRLSGDYNPIHLWGWYARRMNFQRASFHPQRVLGACLARLPALDPARPQRLDAWLKGPVYYGAQVTLRASSGDGQSVFALNMQDESRPAIVGHLRQAAEGQRLADTGDDSPVSTRLSGQER